MDVYEGRGERIFLDHVTFGYTPEVAVLDDVTMAFPRSGVVALRAANGAGKSTLVELVSGYLRPQKGRVEICGHPAASAAARSFRRVVRTKPALYPTMSVFDHLAFTAQLTGAAMDDVLARVRTYPVG